MSEIVETDLDFDSCHMTDRELQDEWRQICHFKDKILSAFSSDLLSEFQEWRLENCSQNQTFHFWDNFIHVDFMSYLGLYFSIRSRNWHLRNASLKKLVCLFHAFDRQNYQRLIPYHLVDLLTFPDSVLDHLSSGCFSVSISGKDMFSVALDEAHEMEINLKSKNALNSFSQTSLATLTFYLPFRAKTIHNLKSEKDDKFYHRETSKSHIKTAEKTVEYISTLKSSSLFVTVTKIYIIFFQVLRQIVNRLTA